MSPKEELDQLIRSLNDLEIQHEQQVKELNIDLDKLRATISGKKVDKKKKKSVESKIDTLKRELEVKHEGEAYELKVKIQELENDISSTENKNLEAPEKSFTTTSDNEEKTEEVNTGYVLKPKVNRHKAKKERKEAERLRMLEEAEKEALSLPNLKASETEAINQLAEKNKLKVFEIPPDGHCLYNAFADQLSKRYGIENTFKQVRSKASEHILSHAEDFMPFLLSADGETPLTLEGFKKYCTDIVDTATWGGQIEITALSQAYKVPVCVYQMSSQPLLVGAENFPELQPLTISYHRHAYGLGAHYNSLRSVEHLSTEDH